MARELKGKTAVITGGNRNNGRAAALALAEAGADVIITYRERRAEADSTVAELELLGVRAAALALDLTDTAGIEPFAAALRGQLAAWDRERFDILVNNAGILRLGTFDAVTEADLDAIYAVNYKSPFFLTQRLLGDLADGGRIINIGSGTARIAFGPLVAYGPLKAALQSLTLYLANFLGPRGIAVNAVAPGGLDNEFNADVFRRLPQARDYIIGGTALGRIGGSADVGGAIAFLAGPAGGFVSGAVLPVDGGYHL